MTTSHKQENNQCNCKVKIIVKSVSVRFHRQGVAL